MEENKGLRVISAVLGTLATVGGVFYLFADPKNRSAQFILPVSILLLGTVVLYLILSSLLMKLKKTKPPQTRIFIGALMILLSAIFLLMFFFAFRAIAPKQEIGNILEEQKVTESSSRIYNPKVDPGGNEFTLEFLIPKGWEVEYDNQARILSLFTLEGEGSARERSQIVLAYFDASQFLTLSSVVIHEVTDFSIGKESYTAKRYDIEKRPGVVAFQDQPSWRSARHIAIDFRDKEGRTRYWSIAKNPQLDEQTFQRVLNSIVIAQQH